MILRSHNIPIVSVLLLNLSHCFSLPLSWSQLWKCINIAFASNATLRTSCAFHLHLHNHIDIHTTVRLWRLRLWQMLCSGSCAYSLLSFLLSSNRFSSFLSPVDFSFILFSHFIKLYPSTIVSPSIPSIFPHFLAAFSTDFIFPSFLPSIHLHVYSPPHLPPPHNMFPAPHPSPDVYQASTLSSASWLMLYRHHPSLRCHNSAIKIQSFSEIALVHHLSFWLWLRDTDDTDALPRYQTVWTLEAFQPWRVLIVSPWSLADDSSHSSILGCGGAGMFLLQVKLRSH